MKKILLVTLLLAAMAISVSAAEAPSVTIDGERVVFADQQPTVIDNRTLVPVRGVFEHLGFTVDWDGDTQTATITNDTYEMRIAIGNTNFTVNHIGYPPREGGRNMVVHTLDVPAQIIGNSTMLPIRLPLESVGVDVSWDETTRTVVISTARDSDEPVHDTTRYSVAPIHYVFAEYAAQHGIYLTDDEIAEILEEIELLQGLFGEDLPTVLENEGYRSLAHLEYSRRAHALSNKVLFIIVDDPEKFAPFAGYLEEEDEELLGAKHILIRFDEFDGDEEAASEFATEIWERAAEGEDFDELMETYGGDPGMVAQPEGYTFTAGVMVGEFEQGTRDLEIGEISEPIRTVHGFHIILRIEPNPENVMRPQLAPTLEQRMAHAVILAFEAKIY